jgi:GTP cyclohydrolase I
MGKMYAEELFYGLDYTNFPDCTCVNNKMAYKEMVIRSGVDVKSMCEHHFLPIVGRAWVAYLPDKKVLGLSKIDRIVDFFSRRPQVQERLTEQIAAALQFILESESVAVVVKAQHFCMSHRGVGASCSDTITSRLYGKFMSVEPLRAEFLHLTK